MFDNDYMMKQIEMITQFLGEVLFEQREDPFTDLIGEDLSVNEGQLLMLELQKLLQQGEINEAENLLFDTIAQGDPKRIYLEAAHWFYTRLTQLDENTLERCDFSTQEILEGLEDIRRLYCL